MGKRILSFLFFLTFIFSQILSQAFSADIFLQTSQGTPLYNYLDLYVNSQIHSGDRLILTPDRHFTVEKVLGHGNTTVIFSVIDSRDGKKYALRLPYHEDASTYVRMNLRFIKYTLKGYEELFDQHVKIPKIYDSKEKLYILSDIVHHRFDLEYFLQNHGILNTTLREESEKALEEFIKQIAAFSRIADFHTRQLLYDDQSKQWVLLDWAAIHHMATWIDDYFILDRVFLKRNKVKMTPALEDLADRLVVIVKNERKQRIQRLDFDEIDRIVERLKSKVGNYLDFDQKLDSSLKLRGDAFLHELRMRFLSEIIDLLTESAGWDFSLIQNCQGLLGLKGEKYFPDFFSKVIGSVKNLEQLHILLASENPSAYSNGTNLRFIVLNSYINLDVFASLEMA